MIADGRHRLFCLHQTQDAEELICSSLKWLIHM